MKVARTEHLDITPDRSIFHKIGEANYSISDAIAELVDNSIDAANEDGIEVYIILDKKNGKIIISDNGRGMDKVVAAKALILAHSTKKRFTWRIWAGPQICLYQSRKLFFLGHNVTWFPRSLYAFL